MEYLAVIHLSRKRNKATKRITVSRHAINSRTRGRHRHRDHSLGLDSSFGSHIHSCARWSTVAEISYTPTIIYPISPKTSKAMQRYLSKLPSQSLGSETFAFAPGKNRRYHPVRIQYPSIGSRTRRTRWRIKRRRASLLDCSISPDLEPVGRVNPGWSVEVLGIRTYKSHAPVEVDKKEDPVPAIIEQPVRDILKESTVCTVRRKHDGRQIHDRNRNDRWLVLVFTIY